MQSTLRNSAAFFLAVCLLFTHTLSFAQQPSGTVTGTISDAKTGELLPGANVRIAGTTIGDVSDIEGRFALASVPAGSQTLVVSYVGFKTRETVVNVPSGGSIDLGVELEDNFLEMEGITVSGNRQGQARALNQQKNAVNIKNVVAADLIGRFPDPNVAEALRRVPAVSVQRDQGEARYIQVRGTNPNLSNVSINGEQIPSPEGDVRFAALDMIPSDVLSSIEVNKAITPDMDGDAIGGAVNLNTLSATDRGRVLNATLSAGYNNLNQDLSPFGGNGSLTWGNRTADGRFGYMVSGSYNRSNRASNNNEMAYDEGELEEMELRDYELTRERLGVIGSFDYRFNPRSKIYLNGNYTYFSDQEYRRALIIEPVAAVREVKDRFEEQKIFSISGGGNHLLGNNFQADYQLSYSYADQNTPKDHTVAHVQEYEDDDEEIEWIRFSRANPDYPQFSLTPDAPGGAGIFNYGQYEFDELEYAFEQTSDQHFTSRINFKTNYDLGQAYGEFKFGGLFRTKNKERNPDINFFGFDGDFPFSAIQGTFRDTDFLFGEYGEGVGFMQDPGRLSDFFDANRSSFEREDEDSIVDTEAERYDASEDTWAGYAMTRLDFGRVGGLAGFRYEFTATEYDANRVEFNEDGDLLPVEATSGTKDFDFLLPMVHLNFRPSDDVNLRLAWTNSFAKPNYFDLAPYQIVNREDEEIELGNPDLDATKSMNFDLMAEYYFNNVGIISAGLFYKRIDDFIYVRLSDFEGGTYDGYEAEQPVNGDEADLLGFELNLQQQLTFLPGFLDGLGVYANYTYSWSEARLTVPDGGERTVSLPGQAENTGNLALSYEKHGFSGRISLSYAGAFVDELRDDDSNDRIYDEHVQLDLSASQRITPNIRVFMELVNLTNEPLRYYNGVSSRPEQQEYYSWWGNMGVKFNF